MDYCKTTNAPTLCIYIYIHTSYSFIVISYHSIEHSCELNGWCDMRFYPSIFSSWWTTIHQDRRRHVGRTKFPFRYPSGAKPNSIMKQLRYIYSLTGNIYLTLFQFSYWSAVINYPYITPRYNQNLERENDGS